MKLASRLIGIVCCLALVGPAGAWPHRHHTAWPRLRAYRYAYGPRGEIDCEKLLYGPPILDDSGERTRTGKLRRNRAAREAFQCRTPCPSTHATRGPCPGYVVDHIVPLKEGGADLPSNMQWQTIAQAKAKDRVE